MFQSLLLQRAEQREISTVTFSRLNYSLIIKTG